ncbi:MAG: 1,4-alpha-glucan branching protein GlgB [Candidatus Omnitrophica bacterium]|nr:1,4-alpha-glucan branching protein GlgB [Candidatus Omnitrophota bacterium]
MQVPIENQSFITDHDIYLFREGNHLKLYEKLGSHCIEKDGKRGVHFAVWAPNAQSVSVVGDFNYWTKGQHPLFARWDSSGIWEGFIEGIGKGALYKYSIVSNNQNYSVEKRDPYAFFNENPPKTASIVWDLDNTWNDQQWMKKRYQHNALDKPMSIYEIHLGSWRRVIEENNRYLTYRELAQQLVDYIKEIGFTHVEFLPVMEHPFYGSWGYQSIGYFAPTNRYGTPQDFMFLIDMLHQNDIGVILDWVPSHFPSDEHGLVYFDGTKLYEHADEREGFHPDWKSYIFNCGRVEVKEFLISSAIFWLEKYHVDGLRVDAVASMLYRDYSRKAGEWIPNKYGGRENLESIDFLKQLNKTVYEYFPDTQVIAEESTAWPSVSRPLYLGGLGFGMKWNMGWMHDTLSYFAQDPIYRKYHHGELTFSYLYAFTENFVLSLSHDEVVHGKGSLINKMPGDLWQKFANLRLLFAYMFTHPGKKLLFMGSEIGQWTEWNHEKSLDWHLLSYPAHSGLQRCVKDLNALYKREPALYQTDFSAAGFHCVDASDAQQSIISFLRKTQDSSEDILIVCNFTPAVRLAYRVGVPQSGYWREILNTDAQEYGGSGQGNCGGKDSDPVAIHGFYHSLSLTLPPLGIVVFKKQ